MLTPRQFQGWQWYREIEPFGIDEGDFRAMTLNSLIAGIVGAKIPPEAFTLRNFIAKIHAAVEWETSDEAKLDGLFGIRPEVN